jgi:hypothetical protein
MRCMGCGAEMALTAIVPDETMAVRGFEHKTFQCLGCEVTETRLTFTRSTARRTELITPVPVKPSSQPDGTSSGAPAGAWIRAVEMLRNHQAGIHARPREAEKTDREVEFNRHSEQLAPPRREAGQSGDSTDARPKDLSAIFARAVRERLRKTTKILVGHNGGPEPLIERNPVTVQQFNLFWDSLAWDTPLRLPSDPASASVAPSLPLLRLPKSAELMPLEAVVVDCAQ